MRSEHGPVWPLTDPLLLPRCCSSSSSLSLSLSLSLLDAHTHTQHNVPCLRAEEIQMLPLNAQDAQKGRSSSPPTISPMRGRKEGRKEEADVEKSMLTTTTQTLPLSLTHSLTHLCVWTARIALRKRLCSCCCWRRYSKFSLLANCYVYIA